MAEIDTSAAEAKINEVLMYRKFIDCTLFPEGWSEDDFGIKVQKEIINFIRSKVNDLMGLSPGKKLDPSFSEDEVKALKVLASRIVNQASGVVEEEQEEEEEPVERVVATASPKEKKPTKPIKPSKKPKPTITVLPNDQDVIEEGGEKYKIKLAQIDPDSCVGPDSDIISKLKNNECTSLIDGGLVGRKGDSYFRVIKIKLLTPSPTFDRDKELMLSQQGAIGVASNGQKFLENFAALIGPGAPSLLDSQEPDSALSRMDDL
jgi:hypothetical protein